MEGSLGQSLQTVPFESPDGTANLETEEERNETLVLNFVIDELSGFYFSIIGFLL